MQKCHQRYKKIERLVKVWDGSHGHEGSMPGQIRTFHVIAGPVLVKERGKFGAGRDHWISLWEPSKEFEAFIGRFEDEKFSVYRAVPTARVIKEKPIKVTVQSELHNRGNEDTPG